MAARDLTAGMASAIADGRVRPVLFYEGKFGPSAAVIPSYFDAAAKSDHLTLWNDNRSLVTDGNASYQNAFGAHFNSSGKRYVEIEFYIQLTNNYPQRFGLVNGSASYADGQAIGNTANDYAFEAVTGHKKHNLTDVAYGDGDPVAPGTRIGMLWDADAGQLSWSVAGVDQGVAYTGVTGSFTFAITGHGTEATTDCIIYASPASWAYAATYGAGLQAFGSVSPDPEYLRLFTGIGTLSWDSKTWTGGGKMLAISPIKEVADTQAVGFSITLSGLPAAEITRAQDAIRQGYPGKLWLGLFNTAGALIADPYMLRRGKFDIAVIARDGATCTIEAKYEDRLIDLERARARRYTSADQQRDYPADLGFDYVPSLQDMQILWR